MAESPRIVPSLWFDTQAEEAITHYIETFSSAPHRRGESRIITIQRYEKGMEVPGAEQMLGKVLTAIFELDGQRFMALDGGPIFTFNEVDIALRRVRRPSRGRPLLGAALGSA